MPIHFGRFRYLNGPSKRIENESSFYFRVRVDEGPEIIIPPGEEAEVPEGAELEVDIEESP